MFCSFDRRVLIGDRSALASAVLSFSLLLSGLHFGGLGRWLRSLGDTDYIEVSSLRQYRTSCDIYVLVHQSICAWHCNAAGQHDSHLK